MIDLERGARTYLTRKGNNPIQFAKDFKNAQLFLVLSGEQNEFVPLNWAILAETDQNWRSATSAGRSSNARTTAEKGGLKLVKMGSSLHDELWTQSSSICNELTADSYPKNKQGFSKDTQGPRKQTSNNYYVLSTSTASPNASSGNSKDANEDNVLAAMSTFDSDGAPNGFGRPRIWFALHPNTKRPYPAKVIWGLATSRNSAEFTAHQARDNLRKLGFRCLRLDVPNTARDFDKMVSFALSEKAETRRRRLKTADPRPVAIVRQVLGFVRNRDVIAERLFLANGHCDACKIPAPFIRRSDQTPYLEVHHILPLCEGGLDNVENTEALCANCHRFRHSG